MGTVTGTNKQFFGTGIDLLSKVAKNEGYDNIKDLDIITMDHLKSGSFVVHNGLTWHGSDRNKSTCNNNTRKGIGLHFVPANVKFTKDAVKSKLWRKYVSNMDTNMVEQQNNVLLDCHFPVTYKHHS